MKKQKMSLEKMRGVLNNVLSREEMREVMAGSGGPGAQCGTCPGLPGTFPPPCYFNNSACRCGGNLC